MYFKAKVTPVATLHISEDGYYKILGKTTAQTSPPALLSSGCSIAEGICR